MGLRAIAERVHALASWLAVALTDLGYELGTVPFFDTLQVKAGSRSSAHEVAQRAAARGINLRVLDAETLAVSLDETTTRADLRALLSVLSDKADEQALDRLMALSVVAGWPEALRRTSAYLTHPVFNTHHTETEMLRYLRRLESRDLSLCTSMIPLGSCTMKLNATAEMLPVTWPTVSRLHPFASTDQTRGLPGAFPAA